MHCSRCGGGRALSGGILKVFEVATKSFVFWTIWRRNASAASVRQCQRACRTEPQCQAFTFITDSALRRRCWLKQSGHALIPQASSGTVSCMVRRRELQTWSSIPLRTLFAPKRRTLYWMNLARRTDKRVRFESMLGVSMAPTAGLAASSEGALRVVRVEAIDGDEMQRQGTLSLACQGALMPSGITALQQRQQGAFVEGKEITIGTAAAQAAAQAAAAACDARAER
jgi:hypothetical protein